MSVWMRALVALLLVPPYAVLGLMSWWYFFDDAPPLRILYQHPYFLSQPVESRDDAFRHEVSEVAGGGTVYIYREICIDRDVPGVLRARWVARGFVWPLHDRASLSSAPGCHKQSYAVAVPTSSPTRTLTYETERDYQVNPLRAVTVAAPPLTLTVLAP